MRFFFDEIHSNEERDVTGLFDIKELEAQHCYLSSLMIICKEPLFAWASTYGRIEFINPDDEQQYFDKVRAAQSYFEDYFLIRIAIGFGLFLSTMVSYLAFSWIVHFIIYGAKIGSQKKRPYQ